MDLAEVRAAIKRGESVYKLPLRVTFYARVSSDTDAQLNSLENQTTYFTDHIEKAGGWKLVPGYVDEGISGITTTKRASFNRMLDDAKRGKFDLVVTKEISRFARNTLDSISHTRELLSAGVAVIFQNDGISTLDEDAELRLTIMAAIAQEEVRKLSGRIKFGHKQAIKKGVVLGNSRIYGYTLSGGKLHIDEHQAGIVREVFELYSTGKFTMKGLEKHLFGLGYRNHNGKAITHPTLARMIRNPKYKGFYVGGKVQIVDLFTKKQKFIPESDWTMYKDETGESVPAIVSEELWQAANDVLAVRSADVTRRQNKTTHGNLLTGKLYCGECGSPFYRKESKRKNEAVSRWMCSGALKYGREHCHAVYVGENDLIPVIASALRNTGTGESLQAMEAYISAIRVMNSTSNIAGKIEAAENDKVEIEARKMKLLSFNVAGKISDDDFFRMNEGLTVELEKCISSIAALREQERDQGDVEEKIAQVRAAFEAARKAAATGIINRQFIEKTIDRVTVYPPDGNNTISIEIALITGERVSNGIVRSGSMVKKMIEAQERAMSGQR